MYNKSSYKSCLSCKMAEKLPSVTSPLIVSFNRKLLIPYTYSVIGGCVRFVPMSVGLYARP